jgi:transcriptional regulator with XRE-family HTH domain
MKIFFGSRVRVKRKQLKMTQADLAAACELDRTYIGGIERGERNPSLENIAKIASALDTTISDLMRE